jgi:uncharacterized protein
MISEDLINAIRQRYQLDWQGIHGSRHWGRVLENGLKLAQATNANPSVVELFAVFHDSQRLNDNFDPDHGLRGAQLAEEFRGQFFELDDEAFTLLYQACQLHAEGFTEADPTVQTCWDADRLDLGRVGIFPEQKLLCTAAAREIHLLQWANARACCDFQTTCAVGWCR